MSSFQNLPGITHLHTFPTQNFLNTRLYQLISPFSRYYGVRIQNFRTCEPLPFQDRKGFWEKGEGFRLRIYYLPQFGVLCQAELNGICILPES
jgi:hypothetical protein